VSPPATDLQGRLDIALPAVAGPAPEAVLAAVIDGEVAVAYHGAADAGSVFELGSMTKTFTALLLAVMVERGEVGYDDPITAHLPTHALPRRHAARSITLGHLATHTAGLPRLPPNLYLQALPRWGTNPYAGYRPGHLYRATTRIRTRSEPGRRVRYSNYGIGLLGHLLGLAGGADYPTLLRDRVCTPLGLARTRVTHQPGDLIGHRRGRSVPPWEMDALAGAGILRSTPTDLLRYLTALLHPDSTPLSGPLRAVRQPRATINETDRMCLV
jgi:CubicO group peptidase (beta-lactamase class C family)